MKKLLCLFFSVLMCLSVCSCFGSNEKTVKKYDAKADMIKKYAKIVKSYQNNYGEMSLLEYKAVQNKALGGVCFLDLLDLDKNGLDELIIAWFDGFDSNSFASYNIEVYSFNKKAKKAETIFENEYVYQSRLSFDLFKNKPYSAVKILDLNGKKYIQTGDSVDHAFEFFGFENGKSKKAISFLQVENAFYVDDEQVKVEKYDSLIKEWKAFDSDLGNIEEYPLSPIKFEDSNGYGKIQTTIDVTNKTLSALGLSLSQVSFNNATEPSTETTTTTTEPTTTSTTTTVSTTKTTEDTRGAVEYTGEYITYYGKKASDSAPCYGVNIESVESGYITFTIYKLGYNGSPGYYTGEISARLKNDKASFTWEDSWGNKGKGKLKISKSVVTINMKETKTSEFNRSSLNTEGDLKLYKK